MQSRGAVTAVRAAAMGLVATGLIEVLARVAPRVDPLYIYLGAVALVVLIDGVLPGALAAVAVTEIYALLYAPKSRSLFENTMWALALSAGTLLAAAAIRGLVRARRRRPPEIFTPMPVMLGTSLVEEPPVQSNAEILAALDELRAEVRAAVATPREGRSEEAEKLEKLEHMLAEAHSGEAEQRSRAATATRERDEERARAESFAAELTLLRMELHQGREENGSLNTRIAELETHAMEAEQLRVDLAASREENAGLLKRVAELENAVNEAERLRDHLAASRDETATLLARITELELSMREAERTRTDLAASREENAFLAARNAELEPAAREVDQLRADLAAAREDNASLKARDAELETSAGTTKQLQADLATAREENAFLVARNAELESERANLEQEFDAKLQTIVGHLASDHENDLGQALADKEEARAEARLLSARLSTLQKKYEEDHELATRILTETRASAQREIDALRAKVAAKLAAPPPPPPPPQREGPPRARILVAHPDAELRRNAQASLQAAGYAVITAADGLEALRLASTTHPDVVIADAVMPKMNGRELCQLLKSQEKTANIRVVLLLRNVDEPPKGELLPDDILRKPVPLETLRTTLASLLANQRA